MEHVSINVRQEHQEIQGAHVKKGVEDSDYDSLRANTSSLNTNTTSSSSASSKR